MDPARPLRVAFITTDHREDRKDYARPRPGFGPAPAALLQGFEELPTACEIHVISCTMQPVSTPHRLAENIHSHALHVRHAGWLRTGYLGCIAAVRRKVRELAPDIVHGQGTERYCSLSAVCTPLPSVLTLHGNMRAVARAMKSRLFSFHGITAKLEGLTIPRSAGVVCVSTYTQRQVAALARKTWVVPNAVDRACFDIPRQPSSRPMVLCVASVCGYKNQHRLIRALDPIARALDFELVFAGGIMEEPYGSEFRQMVAERPWCRYAGMLGTPEISALLAQAHLLVLPSLEDNCPMAILEAMAAGVPVVGAAIGGIPDLIQTGINGLLCDPLDEADMGEKVRAILSDPALAGRLAGRAKADAAERFAPKNVAQRHLEIYREILAAKAAHAIP